MSESSNGKVAPRPGRPRETESGQLRGETPETDLKIVAEERRRNVG